MNSLIKAGRYFNSLLQSINRANKFAYFYYYKNQFPLATLNDDLTYSEEGANEEISLRGKDLIMEYTHWSRLGENARILAFLPDAYLAGSPENPSVRLFNTLVFISGLMLLFWGFWRIKKPIFGLLLVMLINCTPFFLYEIFSNQNIFGVLAAVFFMILGINLPLLFSKALNFKRVVFTVLISALLIGFFSEFRNEISVVLVSLLLLCLAAKNLKISKKIVLIVLAIISFNLSKKLIRNHFELKFEEASELVRLNKGHVYKGAKISGHNFWHPVFCGLGDYDTKYGYEWNDKKAYAYAIPIEELMNYEKVVKAKVVSDIKNDPMWYVTILIKRVFKTLTTTIPLPYVGWLIFPLTFYLFKKKKWSLLKLILVSLPLSATSIMVYSGKGSTYNSVFVYFIMAIILTECCYHYKNSSKYVEE